jgi:hypothetical protein
MPSILNVLSIYLISTSKMNSNAIASGDPRKWMNAECLRRRRAIKEMYRFTYSIISKSV